MFTPLCTSQLFTVYTENSLEPCCKQPLSCCWGTIEFKRAIWQTHDLDNDYQNSTILLQKAAHIIN